MIGIKRVAEFVKDHIVDGTLACFNQIGIEYDLMFFQIAAPALFQLSDFQFGARHVWERFHTFRQPFAENGLRAG